jgi:uncharacterized protein DUF4129
VNRVSLTGGLAAMDLCSLYPWSVLLGLWSGSERREPLLAPATIFLLVLLGALSTQVLGRRARTSRAARTAIAALAVVAAVVAARIDQYPSSGVIDWFLPLATSVAAAIGHLTAPVLAFALALYLWWRGVRLGSQTASFTEVEGSFRWGIARLVLFGLVIAVTTRPSELPSVEARTTPAVVGFFFFSLLTLALGRLESLRTRTRTLSVNTQWFGVLVLIAAVVVLFALFVGQLVSFDLLLVATRPLFDLLGAVLLLLIYLIVIPVAYVIQWLVYLILSLVQADSSRQPPEAPQPTDIDNMLRRFFSEQVPPELLVALKTAGAAIVIGIAVLIVARSLSRWRPSGADADATNEERDSLWDAQHMQALLRAWLRRLLRRDGRPMSVESAPSSPTPADGTAATLSNVRQLYAQLLRLGETVGARRQAATTPLEHMPALSHTLEPEEPVSDLTAAYILARYAENEPTPAETAALGNALRTVRPKSASH